MLLAVVLLAVPDAPSPRLPDWSDVRPIMQAHCVACHHDGGEAPFSLVQAADVGKRASFIKEVTARRLMPPWLPSSKGLPMRDARGLSEAEIDTLAAWADGGHPIGEDDSAATTVAAEVPEADLLIAMPDQWTIPAEGTENWGRRDRDKWTFVIPIGNAQPLRVQALTHTSTASDTVHAVSYLADATGTAKWLDGRDDAVGYYLTGDIRDRPSGDLGSTGVGSRTTQLPDGYHWEIPSGSDLVMQVHFRPAGRPRPLQDTLGLELVDGDDGEQSRPVRTLLSMVQRVDIPIGQTDSVRDEYVLPEDIDVVAITPRAMGICTSMTMSADVPGEAESVLLEIPDWDPHWRQPFVLKEALSLPAGTVIHATWTLANTETNPRNPFLPLERFSMARRTGAVAMLLHVAAEDEAADDRLMQWHSDMMRSRSH